MDRTLAEVEALLVDFPSEQGALKQALRLAKDVEDAALNAEPSTAAREAAQKALLRLSDLLAPPAVFCVDADELDATARLAKDAFRQQAPSLLELARSLSQILPAPGDLPSQADMASRARLVLAFGRFAHVDLSAGVSTRDAAAFAQALIDRLIHGPAPIRFPLLRHLLCTSLPPFFRPHPKLNPATGRVLSRPLGGDRGMTEWFEESDEDATSWRRQAGLGSVVKVVVEALEPAEVEDLWPFLLPPLLAYLDDYEAANKVIGISVLDALLNKADASLLRRTGVGKVFEKSLENAFSSLSDPLSPSLVASAHPVALKLLTLQHPASSTGDDQPRFDALCALLSASVTHTWEFKSGHVALETVSCLALPPLLDALGAGSIRYLQLLVPHLCGVLTSANGTWTRETAGMLHAAAVALGCVARNARARVSGRWEGRIGAAVAHCWVEAREDEAAVQLREGEEGRGALQELEGALRAVVEELGRKEGGASLATPRLVEDPALRDLFSPSAVAAR